MNSALIQTVATSAEPKRPTSLKMGVRSVKYREFANISKITFLPLGMNTEVNR